MFAHQNEKPSQSLSSSFGAPTEGMVVSGVSENDGAPRVASPVTHYEMSPEDQARVDYWKKRYRNCKLYHSHTLSLFSVQVPSRPDLEAKFDWERFVMLKEKVERTYFNRKFKIHQTKAFPSYNPPLKLRMREMMTKKRETFEIPYPYQTYMEKGESPQKLFHEWITSDLRIPKMRVTYGNAEWALEMTKHIWRTRLHYKKTQDNWKYVITPMVLNFLMSVHELIYCYDEIMRNVAERECEEKMKHLWKPEQIKHANYEDCEASLLEEVEEMEVSPPVVEEYIPPVVVEDMVEAQVHQVEVCEGESREEDVQPIRETATATSVAKVDWPFKWYPRLQRTRYRHSEKCESPFVYYMEQLYTPEELTRTYFDGLPEMFTKIGRPDLAERCCIPIHEDDWLKRKRRHHAEILEWVMQSSDSPKDPRDKCIRIMCDVRNKLERHRDKMNVLCHMGRFAYLTTWDMGLYRRQKRTVESIKMSDLMEALDVMKTFTTVGTLRFEGRMPLNYVQQAAWILIKVDAAINRRDFDAVAQAIYSLEKFKIDWVENDFDPARARDAADLWQAQSNDTPSLGAAAPQSSAPASGSKASSVTSGDTIDKPMTSGEKKVNITMMDQREKETAKVPAVREKQSPKDAILQEIQSTVARVASRPQFITRVKWDDTLTIGKHLLITTLPQFYFSSDVKPKLACQSLPAAYQLSQFGACRFDVKIKFQINSTKFQQGRLIAAFIPFYYTDKREEILSNLPQYPHVFIDASVSNPVEMVIPFTNPRDTLPIYADPHHELTYYGVLQLAVWNQLKTGDKGSSDASVSIWANLEGLKVYQMCNPKDPKKIHFAEYPRLVKLKEERLTEAKKLHVTETVTVGIKDLEPQALSSIAEAAGPIVAEVGANLMEGLLNRVSRGPNSKPGTVNPPQPVYPKIASNSGHAVGVDLNTRLSLHPLSATPFDGSMAPPANLKDLMSKWSRIAVYEWSVDDKENFRVGIWPMLPTIGVGKSLGYTSSSWWVCGIEQEGGQCSQRYRGQPNMRDLYRRPTMMDYLAKMFQYWRGGLKYKIEVVCTSMHSGRLVIRYEPCGNLATAVEECQKLATPGLVWDIQENHTLEFTAPYFSYQPFLLSQFCSDGGIANAMLGNVACGVIEISVVNALKCTTGVSQKVDVNVYMAAADDFEFAVLSPLDGVKGIRRYGMSDPKVAEEDKSPGLALDIINDLYNFMMVDIEADTETWLTTSQPFPGILMTSVNQLYWKDSNYWLEGPFCNHQEDPSKITLNDWILNFKKAHKHMLFKRPADKKVADYSLPRCGSYHSAVQWLQSLPVTWPTALTDAAKLGSEIELSAELYNRMLYWLAVPLFGPGSLHIDMFPAAAVGKMKVFAKYTRGPKVVKDLKWEIQSNDSAKGPTVNPFDSFTMETSSVKSLIGEDFNNIYNIIRRYNMWMTVDVPDQITYSDKTQVSEQFMSLYKDTALAVSSMDEYERCNYVWEMRIPVSPMHWYHSPGNPVHSLYQAGGQSEARIIKSYDAFVLPTCGYNASRAANITIQRYLSELFTFWRGSMRYRFTIPDNKGALLDKPWWALVTYNSRLFTPAESIPGFHLTSISRMRDAARQGTELYNSNIMGSFEVEVPFYSMYKRLVCDPVLMDATTSSGTISVFLPVRTNGGEICTGSNIDWDHLQIDGLRLWVWTACGDDFEFYIPRAAPSLHLYPGFFEHLPQIDESHYGYDDRYAGLDTMDLRHGMTSVGQVEKVAPYTSSEGSFSGIGKLYSNGFFFQDKKMLGKVTQVNQGTYHEVITFDWRTGKSIKVETPEKKKEKFQFPEKPDWPAVDWEVQADETELPKEEEKPEDKDAESGLPNLFQNEPEKVGEASTSATPNEKEEIVEYLKFNQDLPIFLSPDMSWEEKRKKILTALDTKSDVKPGDLVDGILVDTITNVSEVATVLKNFNDKVMPNMEKLVESATTCFSTLSSQVPEATGYLDKISSGFQTVGMGVWNSTRVVLFFFGVKNILEAEEWSDRWYPIMQCALALGLQPDSVLAAGRWLMSNITNIFGSQKGNEEPEPKLAPQAYEDTWDQSWWAFIEEHSSGLRMTAAAIITILIFTFTSKAPPTAKVGGFATDMVNKLRNMAFVGAGFRALDWMFKWVAECIKVAVVTVTDWVSGGMMTAQRMAAHYPEVLEFLQKADKFEVDAVRSSLTWNNDTLMELWKLEDKGNALIAKLESKAGNMYAHLLKGMLKLRKASELSMTQRLMNPFRVDPFHVCLVGDPGVMKSSILTHMLNFVCDKMEYAKTNRFYSRSEEEEYWSSYWGQTCVIIDDLYADKDGKAIKELVKMKTNLAYQVPMAAIEDKGRMFTSRLIGSTTNTEYPEPPKATKFEAIWRRRNLLIRVKDTGTPGRKEKSWRELRFDILDPNRKHHNVLRSNLKAAETLALVLSMYQEWEALQTGLVFAALNGKDVEFPDYGDIGWEEDRVIDSAIDGLIAMMIKNRNITQKYFNDTVAKEFDVEKLRKLWSHEQVAANYGNVLWFKLWSAKMTQFFEARMHWYGCVETLQLQVAGLPNLKVCIDGMPQFFTRDGSKVSFALDGVMQGNYYLILNEDGSAERFQHEAQNDFEWLDVEDAGSSTEYDATVFLNSFDEKRELFNSLIQAHRACKKNRVRVNMADANEIKNFIDGNFSHLKAPIKKKMAEDCKKIFNEAVKSKQILSQFREQRENYKIMYKIFDQEVIQSDKYWKETTKQVKENGKTVEKKIAVWCMPIEKCETQEEHDFSSYYTLLECEHTEDEIAEMYATAKHSLNINEYVPTKTWNALKKYVESKKEAWSKWCADHPNIVAITKALAMASGCLLAYKALAWLCPGVFEKIKEYISRIFGWTKSKIGEERVDKSIAKMKELGLSAKATTMSWIQAVKNLMSNSSDPEIVEASNDPDAVVLYAESLTRMQKQVKNVATMLPEAIKVNPYHLGDDLKRQVSRGSIRVGEGKQIAFMKEKIAEGLKKKSTNYEDQGSADPQMVQLANHVLPNSLVRLTWFNSEGMSTLNGIIVKGTYLLAPWHFFAPCSEGTQFTISFLDGRTFTDIFERRRCAKAGKQDFCIYKCRRIIGDKKNLVKHFIKVTDHITTTPAALIKTIPGAMHMTMVEADIATSVSYNITDGERQNNYLAWSYEAETEKGDCGAALIAVNSRMERKIMGIHVAGVPKKGMGSSCYVCQEELEELISMLEDPEEPEILDTEYRPENLGSVERAAVIPEGNFYCHGTVAPSKAVRLPYKTEIQESAIHGLVRPPVTAPAVLVPTDPRLEVKGSPLVRAINKYGGDVLPFPWKDLDYITRYITADILMWKVPMKGRLLTDWEAVFGNDSIEYCDRMNLGASPGYPYTLSRPSGEKGKAYLFDVNAVDGIANEDYRWKYKAREKLATAGCRIESLWTDCLKDERRPLKKIAAGKTRAFMLPPADFVQLCRKYFMAFCVCFYSNNTKYWSAVGIDPYSFQWTMLVRRLKSCSNFAFGGDFHSFDGIIDPEIFIRFMKIVNAWYKKWDPGWKREHNVIRCVLVHEMMNTYHICKNLVYEDFQGNPSGNPLTVILNTIAHYFYILLAWIGLARKHHPECMALSEFDRSCKGVFYGDDGLVTVEYATSTWFNLNTVSAFLAEHNIEYTDEQKSEVLYGVRPLKECTFLKNGFVKMKGTQYWLAPIAEDTIYELTNWIRKSDDPLEQMRENLENACSFAFHHGREWFDEFVEKVNVALDKKKLRRLVTSYDHELEKFMNKCHN